MWCANVRNLSTGRDLTTSHARFPVWALFPSVSAVYLERAVSKSGLVSEVIARFSCEYGLPCIVT